jgi:hypothetical protein
VKTEDDDGGDGEFANWTHSLWDEMVEYVEYVEVAVAAVVDAVVVADTVGAIVVAVVVDDGEEQEEVFRCLERNVFLDVSTANLVWTGLGDVDETVVGREVVPFP